MIRVGSRNSGKTTQKSTVHRSRICNSENNLTMAKSKLLTALDAHRGRNYKVEKQRKLQKQAAKKKKSKAPVSNNLEQEEDGNAEVNGTIPMPQAESEDWESDESEAAEPGPVCGNIMSCIYLTLIK